MYSPVRVDTARRGGTAPLLKQVAGQDKARHTGPGRDEVEILGALHRSVRALLGQGLAVLAQQGGQLPRAEARVPVSVCPQLATEIQIGPTGKKLLPLTVMK
ncbi:hypothetical protein ACIOEX_10070 [Streptomyces sp. NPDC087850]|uniref:hypothetical protein n=1 Tax=Streptomyces sp. NPDC087850 TaxID=3365809 RepID=UPI00382B72BE